MATHHHYPTNLTDAQWAEVGWLIPAPKPGGRPAKYDRRAIVNAILYVIRSDRPWRSIPADLPPWRSAHGYFLRWKHDGILDRVLAVLEGGSTLTVRCAAIVALETR